MIETKAKKEAAVRWCHNAPVHNQTQGKKPWKNLLISHDQVQENLSLAYYRSPT